MGKKISNEEFLKRCNNKHSNFYDYSLVFYEKMSKKLKIICPIHGEFEQRADAHMNGQKCSKCTKNKKLSNIEFIKKCNEIHNYKYDYSLVNYINSHTKVDIICKNHGKFTQKPANHFNKQGCPKCSKNRETNINEFIEKSNIVHDHKYNYQKSIYINVKTKLIIICPIHGEFEQRPNNHLSGQGCPVCNGSKGEKDISKFLKKHKIFFNRQKKFEGCCHIMPLPFDFYIPSLNLCIEYDGEQHFRKFRFKKNNDKLKIRQLRDNIKNIFCEENNINLLRIKFDEDVNDKLEEMIKTIHN